MRIKNHLALPTILTAVALMTAFATPSTWGDLDPTFSGDGKLLDGIAYAHDYGNDLAFQADGKIVVGAASHSNEKSEFVIARHMPDGSLDPGFGVNGKVTTSFGPSRDVLRSVAIQADGKIVAAGYSSDSETAFALARYHSNGTLDTSFDGDGKLTTKLCAGACDDQAASVAIQSDGKIVAAGFSRNGAAGYDFALTRYNANGSLDTSLNGTGKIVTPVGSANDFGSAVVIQPDGKLVVAGNAFTEFNSQSQFAIARYTTTGSLDTTFNSTGKAMIPVETSSYATSVLIQTDGKIVAAGQSFDGANRHRFALVRCNSDGSLDMSFDGDGKVTTQPGIFFGIANSVTIQPNGNLVAAGYADTASGYQVALVRYNPDGQLDSTFDGDGKVITAIGTEAGAFSVAIQTDGKIAATGYSYNDASLSNDVASVRYNPNGSLDTSFDLDGISTVDSGIFADNSLNAAAIQPDGKIVAVGPVTGKFGIARFNRDGSADTSFGGGDGKAVTAVDSYYYDNAKAVVIQSDGKIVSAGFSCGDCDNFGGPYIALVRYNSDGTQDSSFGDAGIVRAIIEGDSIGNALAVQPDGKLLVAGWGRNGVKDEFLLARFLSNGMPDATFDVDGIVRTSITTGNDGASALALQPDGKIVAVGTAYIADSTPKIVAARYNSDGSLDSSFDGDGKVVTPVANAASATAVAIHGNGKIVVAGHASSGTDWDFAVVRYNANGSLDSSFDGDGKVTTPIGFTTHDIATGTAVQSDGKIIVSGYSHDIAFTPDFTVVRYSVDGTLDPTFSGDGKSITDFDASDDYAEGMAVDRAGRIVVVGRSEGAFALARYRVGANRAIADFDGDGRSDVSVFRPSNQAWYLDRSTEGFRAVQFGLSTDSITPGDFDGDGKTDIAVFRSGVWWSMNSSNATIAATQFGVAGDIPVPADYNGDGRDELAIYRNGQWWLHDLAVGQSSLVQFGLAGDKPVPADFDGDGRADQAVYRNGEWHIYRSSLGYTTAYFGLASDRPVAGDYDNDGASDIAVYRDGIWYLMRSNLGFHAFQFGLAGDVPAPGDYDGDGKTDAAVYRNGTWYVNRSTGGVFVQQFGLSGDRPVPAAYVP